MINLNYLAISAATIGVTPPTCRGVFFHDKSKDTGKHDLHQNCMILVEWHDVYDFSPLIRDCARLPTPL
jgi:hypothetical protein